MSFFKILETKNSEANSGTLFSEPVVYVPDFFITFFFTTLIIFSCFLDLFLVVLLFSKTSFILWAFLLVTCYFRVIFELAVQVQSDKSLTGSKKSFKVFFNMLLTILGLHSTVTSAMILMESFENPNTPNHFPDCSTYPIFHISSENLSLIKIYCYIYLGVRCIPQLFIMSVFICLNHPTGILVYLSTANIVLNMVLFSFTMSITFPIRKTPRVFTNFECLILSASNKFLATLTGCCANMTIFMVSFRHMKYYAFLVHFVKALIWVFPCQTLLSAQHISKFQCMVYLIFFPLVFSFIFIHPFEKTWKLFYYFSYLICGLLDLAFLNVWMDADLSDLTSYSILRMIQFGFLSCFGLLNSLKKGKSCESKEEIDENEYQTG